MVFQSMRQRMRGVVLICAAAIAISLLYVGGSAIWSGGRASVTAIAKVNGEVIGYPAWHSAYIQLVQNQEAAGYRVTPDQSETVQYYALQQLINQELLLQEANNRKIKPSKADINAEFESVKAGFPDEESFKAALAQSNLTESRFKQLLGENLKLEELRNQVTAQVTVTVDEVKEAYEEVSASHILIAPEENTEEAKAAARAKAEEVLARLKAGEDFAAVAKEVSDDPGSAEAGGSLGFFKRGRMVPEFEEAAFSLKVGELSDIVETQYGYHIIKVDDRKLAEGEEFEKAEAELRESIKAEKQDEAFLEWFEGVRKSAAIEIYNNQMRAYEYLVNGELEKAAEAYRLAIEENAENPYLYARLAAVYQELEQPEEAVAQLEIAVEKAAYDSSLQFQLAELYRKLDRKEDALQAYQKASELDPMNFVLHLQLMNAYQAMGEEELVKAEEAQLQTIQKAWAESRKALEEAQEKASSSAEDSSGELSEGEPQQQASEQTNGDVEDSTAESK